MKLTPLLFSPASSVRALPGGIWMLGMVSLCMDTSSELIHSLLPVFMANVLGASMITIGVVEGVAEGAASVSRIFSGVLSDRFRRRKPLVVLGYGLATLAKPVFPLAASIGWVFAARFVDRVAKGIRGSPRDALVADLAPARLRGAAYGLRQALDSIGAFLGPVLAVLFMAWFADDIKAVLWVAVVPAVLSVSILVFGVHEPARDHDSQAFERSSLKFAGAEGLSAGYWLVVTLGAIFTLARFSEAFLILRAQDVGLAVGYAPFIMIIMNVVYAVFAYPAGAAADRMPARVLLLWGLLVLIAADGVLALAGTPALALLGAALWGLHMALTQGLLSKLVADTAPARLRGTAFGIFNLVSGGALILASVIAGSLWSIYGPAATFLAGAAFSLLAIAGLLFYRHA